MRNSLAGIALAGLIGAVVAIVAVASGLLTGGGPVAGKKLVSATVFIDTLGGGCIVTTVPQTIEVFKKETVEWSVVDRCGATASDDVEIKFDAANDPLDPGCTVRKDKKRIKCAMKAAADVKTYKYSVIVGAFHEDPDLEIAP